MYQFHECHWHGQTYLKNRTRRQQNRYKDTSGLINLSKIMDGLQSIVLCQSGNVKNQY